MKDEKVQDVVTNNQSMQTICLWFEKAFDKKVDDNFDNDPKLYEILTNINNKELNAYLGKKMLKHVADRILALREE